MINTEKYQKINLICLNKEDIRKLKKILKNKTLLDLLNETLEDRVYCTRNISSDEDLAKRVNSMWNDLVDIVTKDLGFQLVDYSNLDISTKLKELLNIATQIKIVPTPGFWSSTPQPSAPASRGFNFAFISP